MGLFGAVAVDFCSVIGRHVGHPLTGSIEMMQACIVIAASTSIVCATLAGRHAAVRMLIDRLSGQRQRAWQRLHALLCALFFVALATGSSWLIYDLAGLHEESELLHLPQWPLRALCLVCIAAVVALQLRPAAARDPAR